MMIAGPLAADTGAGQILYPHPAGSPGPLAPSSPAISGAGIVGIVLAVAGGLWLLFVRQRGGRGWAGQAGRLLKVAETRPLGNRQYLVVAAYGKRRFLLGVCPTRIELLSPLDDEDRGSP